jgi:hypothetical protein
VRQRSGLKGRLAKTKFFYQSARPADGSEAFPHAWSSVEARQRLDWGLGGRPDKSARPADGIAQIHPPDHTSAEAFVLGFGEGFQGCRRSLLQDRTYLPRIPLLFLLAPNCGSGSSQTKDILFSFPNSIQNTGRYRIVFVS